MRLPFHYQFLLAPMLIILLLAGLVAYTLNELPRINRENDITRQWELATDRSLIMIATAGNIDQLALRMAATPNKREELLFDYIEQTQIFLENAQHPELLTHAPQDIRRVIEQTEQRLRDPEQVDPAAAHTAISTVLPALKLLSVGFQSQKRTAYINHNHNLQALVSRLINASLTVLGVCIVLGIGLAAWGLQVTRRRLTALTQRAQQVCASDSENKPPCQIRDALDTLDQCLADMAQRLIDTVAVEKVLQGAEHERRRIAMDMHDGVLADLTVLSRTLDQAENAQAKVPAIDALRQNVAELAESIRCVIDDLHPQSLEILGLEAALRSFFARHHNSLGFPAYHFEFDAGAELALRPDQKIHLFRITSEVIHNLIRHAQCSRFEVSVRVVAQHLLCTIEDNGIGMPSPASPTGLDVRGHGCLNIAERARAIGAQASWSKSRFSTGTRFELNLPLIMTPCLA